MLNKVRSGGFTGFELLIVIALVGLLAWLVVSRFSDLSTEARNTERRLDLSIIAAELEAFHDTQGVYPASVTLLSSHSSFIGEGGQTAPDSGTVANFNPFLDPAGNPIDEAGSGSTNEPATGYDPTQRPEGAQYTYAPYGCSTDDPAPADEAAADDEAEAAAGDEAADETETVDDTGNTNFSDCQSFVLYAWLENGIVYKKVSNN